MQDLARVAFIRWPYNPVRAATENEDMDGMARSDLFRQLTFPLRCASILPRRCCPRDVRSLMVNSLTEYAQWFEGSCSHSSFLSFLFYLRLLQLRTPKALRW